MNKAGIIIETPQKAALAELRAAINDILGADVENETKREALRCLVEVGKAAPVTISGCTVEAPK